MKKIIDPIDKNEIFTYLNDIRSKLLWYGPGLFSIEIQRWLLPDKRIIEIEIQRNHEPLMFWEII
jgi:hypothetical protein